MSRGRRGIQARHESRGRLSNPGRLWNPGRLQYELAAGGANLPQLSPGRVIETVQRFTQETVEVEVPSDNGGVLAARGIRGRISRVGQQGCAVAVKPRRTALRW